MNNLIFMCFALSFITLSYMINDIYVINETTKNPIIAKIISMFLLLLSSFFFFIAILL